MHWQAGFRVENPIISYGLKLGLGGHTGDYIGIGGPGKEYARTSVQCSYEGVSPSFMLGWESLLVIKGCLAIGGKSPLDNAMNPGTD